MRQRLLEAHQPQDGCAAHVRQSVFLAQGSVTAGQSPVCHAQPEPEHIPSADPEFMPRVHRAEVVHQPQFGSDAQAMQVVAEAQASHAPQSVAQVEQLSAGEHVPSPHRTVTTSG